MTASHFVTCNIATVARSATNADATRYLSTVRVSDSLSNAVTVDRCTCSDIECRICEKNQRINATNAGFGGCSLEGCDAIWKGRRGSLEKEGGRECNWGKTGVGEGAAVRMEQGGGGRGGGGQFRGRGEGKYSSEKMDGGEEGSHFGSSNFSSNIALLPRAVSILVCFFCIPGKTSFNATQGMECGASRDG